MDSIPSVGAELRRILTELADQAAHDCGCIQRQRAFSGASLVQTLVFGWLSNAAATLEELAAMAGERGVCVTAQALDQRFTPALAACLEQVLSQVVRTVVASAPVAVPLLERFNGVYLLDSTTISLPPALATVWPGCGGQAGQGQAALKLGVRLELSQGRLAGPELAAGRRNDRALALAQEPLPAGSLRLADLGFFSVRDLAAQAAQERSFLSRWQTNTALFDPDGTRWEDVAARLRTAQPAATEPVELAVLLGAKERLPVRLIAVPLPPAVAARRRREKRRRAQRNGYTARQQSLAVADWTILLTNVPATRLTVAEAQVLLRLRWQIELLFKTWKSGASLAHWRSRKPVRILCEVYAKLLGCVLQHWLMVVGCWVVPEHSLAKAWRVVQRHALGLAQAFDQLAWWQHALERVAASLARGGRLTTRADRPNSVQLLRDPTLAGLT